MFFLLVQKEPKKTPEIDIPADFGEALLIFGSSVASSLVILLLASLLFINSVA